MPTRKIAEPHCTRTCSHPEHNPPSHVVFEPGLYEHECPACGRKVRFWVHGFTCEEREPARCRPISERGWFAGPSPNIKATFSPGGA